MLNLETKLKGRQSNLVRHRQRARICRYLAHPPWNDATITLTPRKLSLTFIVSSFDNAVNLCFNLFKHQVTLRTLLVTNFIIHVFLSGNTTSLLNRNSLKNTLLSRFCWYNPTCQTLRRIVLNNLQVCDMFKCMCGK